MRIFFVNVRWSVQRQGISFWSGEYAVLYGAPALKQNLPLRAFVGLEQNSTGKTDLAGISHYVPSEAKFTPYPVAASPVFRRITSLIQKYLSNHGLVDQGLTVHAILETPTSSGASSSSAFSVALATVLRIFLHELTAEEVAAWAGVPTSELIRRPQFAQTHSLAAQFEETFHSGAPIGSSLLSSFLGSLYPIVLTSQPRSVANKSSNRSPLTSTTEAQQSAPLDSAVKLEELLDLEFLPSWPIDFGLIYCGDFLITQAAVTARESFQQDIWESFNRAQQRLQRMSGSPLKPPLAETSKEDFSKHLMEVLQVASTVVFGALEEIFKGHSDDRYVQKLFSGMNMYHQGLAFAGISSGLLDYVCLTLRHEVHRLFPTESAGAKLTGAGRRGDVVFASACHGLRHSISHIIDRMRKETRQNVNLDYASWLDGLEPEGLRVEQMLTTGQYSSFVSHGSFVVSRIDCAGKKIDQVYSVEQFEEEYPKMSLVIDEGRKKISVKGRPLTSKDLRSASATIILLKTLATTMGKSVAKKSLPPSPYTVDRNELQSKIVGPLNQAVAKYLGRKPLLRVTGPLREYTATLQSDGFDLYFVGKKL